ncbi:uncharacterized protein LAESUDRAFT_718874 [Laetiporus sulphureus 93-53]|uniref:Uncharacterized protein n=1 Tax=Laetiporus sulphureus 93-53 TaxID=1314785 RepID=A0A165I4T8_9APHY|nr:uncharacterized protein LAESUDRAFT_718874 [Laetiporus sulphureus 93-53]KZT12595.1 hypothetical protein LAESUDRAFT_718874 [Laetiporus sulphureus 93-53]
MQFPKFPPPPYALSLDQVIVDHADQGKHAVDGLPLPVPTPDAEDWLNERSREELSELLLKADQLIKSRESELGLTSALCKTLYEDNVALKTKHETLLARLPTSPAPSTPTSPLLRPHSPHQPSDVNYSRSPTYSEASLAPPSHRHARRVSITQGELARLADQNAELLDKLEKLETESLQADQAGKRKLRKLEREIQGLREELERTQAKEAELERQALAVPPLSEEEAQRRKEEREERVRVLRAKSGSMSESEGSIDEGVKDFAPPSELLGSSSTRITPTAASFPSPKTPPGNYLTQPTLPASGPLEEELESVWAQSRPTSMYSLSGAESVIVSQLLLKVRELEETNAQIKRQQEQTDERLRSARVDAESMKRMYECLDGEDGLELVLDTEDEMDDSPTKGKRIASGGMVTFSSLRRSIHRDMSKLLEPQEQDGFTIGITANMQSTTRGSVARNLQHPAGRPRKTVMGLFADTGAGDALQAASGSPGILPFRESELGDFTTWSTAATDGIPLPFGTARSVQTPTERSGLRYGRTLGSELGSDLGDDWGATAGNDHLRTTSLYEIAGMDISQESFRSPSPGERPTLGFPTSSNAESPGGPILGQEGCGADPGPSTPPRISGLQLNVQPPTPSPDQLKAYERQFRLSQTVRSRTHRWVEGRFSPPALPEDDSVRRYPGTSPRMRSGLDSVMIGALNEEVPEIKKANRKDNMRSSTNASRGSESIAQGPADADAGAGSDRATVQLRADSSAILGAAGTRNEGFTGYILEVWLWLQFVIVILVFLWAMAKRGPKSVLEEAEQRRRAPGGGALPS